MLSHRFTTKDIEIKKKYDFIVKQLEGIEFYIELDEDGLQEHYESGRSLDLIWDIGYDTGYTKYNRMGYWIDILQDIVQTNDMTDKEYDLYIEFQGVFEDLCVDQCEKFESMIHRVY